LAGRDPDWSRSEVKCSRYAWLKGEGNLTAKPCEQLTWHNRPSLQSRTARAARWRDGFNAFYDHDLPAGAEAYLRRRCYGAKRPRLAPIEALVATVEACQFPRLTHSDGYWLGRTSVPCVRSSLARPITVEPVWYERSLCYPLMSKVVRLEAYLFINAKVATDLSHQVIAYLTMTRNR
jgi:hypothetical protein